MEDEEDSKIMIFPSASGQQVLVLGENYSESHDT